MPHLAKTQDPVERKHLRNSVAKNSQKAGVSVKKDGAGGKHTWGKLGDEYSGSAVTVLDRKDPNFDPEEAPGAVLYATE